jgi:release factor glutamine methyltransferase
MHGLMTIRHILSEIHRQLAGLYPATEIESFIRILFRHYLNMTPAQIHLSQNNELPAAIGQQILTAIDELKKYRPIQYILGVTEFYGLPFTVTPDVLIPRPETEELVDWIVHKYDRDALLSIVDIGTGSGCIAISLAANFPNAHVRAVDISGAALTVARQNALKNKVKVNFLQEDILKDGLTGFESDSLDVVVSNPPYVRLSDQQQMQPNVLQYEPHSALFTPGDDPLIFYRRIAALGIKCLKKQGKIFFEINEAFPAEVADILKQYNYSDIVSRKDINGKWRMVSAQR